MDSYEKRKAALQKLVKPHWGIPDQLLDDIAKIRGFSVSYVRRAAHDHSHRYPSEMFDYRTLARQIREIANRQCDLMMSGRDAPNVFLAGGMLEYHMVADALEKMAQDYQANNDQFPRGLSFGDLDPVGN